MQKGETQSLNPPPHDEENPPLQQQETDTDGENRHSLLGNVSRVGLMILFCCCLPCFCLAGLIFQCCCCLQNKKNKKQNKSSELNQPTEHDTYHSSYRPPNLGTDESADHSITICEIDATPAPATLSADQRQEYAEKFKTEGNRCFASKQYHDALLHFTKAIEMTPNNSVLYCNRAAIHTALKNFDSAVRDCKMSIELDPQYAKAYNRLGTAYWNREMIQESIDQGYQMAVNLEPGNESFLHDLQNAQQKIKEQQDRSEKFKTEGNTLMSQNKFQEAVESYTQAIHLCPENSIFYCNRAAAFTSLGKFENAITDSKKAIELNPQYAKAYSRLGTALDSCNQFAEAVEAFTKAVELEPSNETFQQKLKEAQSKL